MEDSGKPSTAQIVLLATSSALTAVFYSFYRRRLDMANGLKDAKRISIDQGLRSLLVEAAGKCVPYAVIEGVVKSVKETLSSQYVDNCTGVIERLTLREQKMVWNRATHIWNDCEKIIHQRTKTVPFNLVSQDEGMNAAVRVTRPLESMDLDLEMVYENFHPAVQSFSDTLGNYLSGEHSKGIKETEEMLKVGESIMGVGELILDNKLIKLRPPKQGLPYFLTRLDYEALLSKQQSSVKLWKVLTVVFGLATCATLFFVLRKRYIHYKERQKLKIIREEYREMQAQRLRELNLEPEVVSPSACTICLASERSCVFLECGHVCSCDECYHALPQPKKCPMCRKLISRVVPLYNS
ncbi:MUL1 ligase, partial [Amia calva]|nr:MUL1 ligase [Amia calva]